MEVIFKLLRPIRAASGLRGLVPGKKEVGIDGIGIGLPVPGDVLKSHCIVGALYPGGGEVTTFLDSAYAPPLPDLRHPPDP